MLVLSRRLGETIVIGKPGDVLTSTIEITVLGVSGNQTRMGISAQKNMSVHREEVAKRIELEVQQHAQAV